MDDAALGRDIIESLEANKLAWSYFSYYTYYSWTPLLTANSNPCGPFTYETQTPTSQLLQSAWAKN